MGESLKSAVLCWCSELPKANGTELYTGIREKLLPYAPAYPLGPYHPDLELGWECSQMNIGISFLCTFSYGKEDLEVPTGGYFC